MRGELVAACFARTAASCSHFFSEVTTTFAQEEVVVICFLPFLRFCSFGLDWIGHGVDSGRSILQQGEVHAENQRTMCQPKTASHDTTADSENAKNRSSTSGMEKRTERCVDNASAIRMRSANNAELLRISEGRDVTEVPGLGMGGSCPQSCARSAEGTVVTRREFEMLFKHQKQMKWSPIRATWPSENGKPQWPLHAAECRCYEGSYSN